MVLGLDRNDGVLEGTTNAETEQDLEANKVRIAGVRGGELPKNESTSDGRKERREDQEGFRMSSLLEERDGREL